MTPLARLVGRLKAELQTHFPETQRLLWSAATRRRFRSHPREYQSGDES